MYTSDELRAGVESLATAAALPPPNHKQEHRVEAHFEPQQSFPVSGTRFLGLDNQQALGTKLPNFSIPVDSATSLLPQPVSASVPLTPESFQLDSTVLQTLQSQIPRFSAGTIDSSKALPIPTDSPKKRHLLESESLPSPKRSHRPAQPDPSLTTDGLLFCQTDRTSKYGNPEMHHSSVTMINGYLLDNMTLFAGKGMSEAGAGVPFSASPVETDASHHESAGYSGVSCTPNLVHMEDVEHFGEDFPGSNGSENETTQIFTNNDAISNQFDPQIMDFDNLKGLISNGDSGKSFQQSGVEKFSNTADYSYISPGNACSNSIDQLQIMSSGHTASPNNTSPDVSGGHSSYNHSSSKLPSESQPSPSLSSVGSPASEVSSATLLAKIDIPSLRKLLTSSEFKEPNLQKKNIIFFHSRELKILERNFSTPKPYLVVLYGEFVGKTTTAKMLVDKAKSVNFPTHPQRYNRVIWLKCMNYNALLASLNSELVSLNLINRGKQMELPYLSDIFVKWLQGTTEKYLLVFDGVNSFELLETMFRKLSKFTGHVLITTKNSENVETFAKKSGGESLLLPIGKNRLSESDVVDHFKAKGLAEVREFLNDVSDNESQVLPCVYAKSTTVREKISFLKYVQKVTADRATPLTTLVLEFMISSIAAKCKVFGSACILLLKILSLVSSERYPVSNGFLVSCLNLSKYGVQISQLLSFLEEEFLIRSEPGVNGNEKLYWVELVVQDYLLQRDYTSDILKAVVDGISNSINVTFAKKRDYRIAYLTQISQYIEISKHINLHLELNPDSSKILSTCSVDRLCKVLLKAANYLSNFKYYRKSLEALDVAANLYTVMFPTRFETQLEVTRILDLAGCIACKLVWHESTADKLVSAVDMLFLSMRDSRETYSDIANSQVIKCLTAMKEHAYYSDSNYATIGIARQYLNLTYIHSRRALIAWEVLQSNQSTFAQKVSTARVFSELRNYAENAVDVLSNCYGSYKHVDVIGALTILLSAYVMEGDQIMAFGCVKQILSGLESLFGMTPEIAFDECQNESNAPEFEEYKVNKLLAQFSEKSRKMLERQVFRLKVMDVSSDSDSSVEIANVKQLYRAVLLASSELRDLKCGKFMRYFMERYV